MGDTHIPSTVLALDTIHGDVLFPFYNIAVIIIVYSWAGNAVRLLLKREDVTIALCHAESEKYNK